MGKTIAVVNQKGGVGKSTTSINLGACLAQEGKKVLLIDSDPQGNTTSGIGIEKKGLQNCIYDLLVNDLTVATVLQKTQVDNLDLIPATIQLAGAEIELVSAISRENKLKRALEEVVAKYDYILIDCPPSLGLLTLNALTAANSVIIPIQCEYYALEGLSQLFNTIQLVRKHLNSGLEIEGVILTMYDPRTNLGQQVAEEVKNFLPNKVYETVIPRNIRLSEAPSFGQPIIIYDAKSKGAKAYVDLAQEVISHE